MPHDRSFALILLAALGAAGLACAPVEPGKEAAEQSVPPAPEAPALKPFEDLPPLPSAKSSSTTPFSESVELEQRSVWKRALALAAEAEKHFAAAEEAHRAGDRAALNEAGREARTLFDRALEETALFEEEIVAAHGERDPAVKRIVQARNGWFDRTRWLHKSISR